MFPLSALPSPFPVGLRCASRRGEGFIVGLCTGLGGTHTLSSSSAAQARSCVKFKAGSEKKKKKKNTTTGRNHQGDLGKQQCCAVEPRRSVYPHLMRSCPCQGPQTHLFSPGSVSTASPREQLHTECFVSEPPQSFQRPFRQEKCSVACNLKALL